MKKLLTLIALIITMSSAFSLVNNPVNILSLANTSSCDLDLKIFLYPIAGSCGTPSMDYFTVPPYGPPSYNFSLYNAPSGYYISRVESGGEFVDFCGGMSESFTCTNSFKHCGIYMDGCYQPSSYFPAHSNPIPVIGVFEPI